MNRLETMGQKGKQLQMLIVILPDISGSYGEYQKDSRSAFFFVWNSCLIYFSLLELCLASGTIKRVCETELGIVSQCCQPKQASKLNKQYLENVALKINVKVCLPDLRLFVLHFWLFLISNSVKTHRLVAETVC